MDEPDQSWDVTATIRKGCLFVNAPEGVLFICQISQLRETGKLSVRKLRFLDHPVVGEAIYQEGSGIILIKINQIEYRVEGVFDEEN